MEGIKLSEIALECGLKPKDILEKAKDIGLVVKSANSNVSEADADILYKYITEGIKPKGLQVEKPKKTTATTKPKKEKKSDSVDEKDIVVAKPSTPKQEKGIQKVEPKPKEDDLSQTLVNKRVGITIVKKNSASVAKKPQILPDINELLDTSESSIKSKPKKKEKPKQQVSNRANEQKIDISRDLGGEYDEEQNEVVLFDLNDYQYRDEEEETKVKQAITDRVRVQKKNPWINEGGISRKTKKRRSAPRDDFKKVAQSSIAIPEEIRVYEFADLASIELKEVIGALFRLGVLVTKNDFLDKDAIEILADEFKIEISFQENVIESSFEDEVVGDFFERPPVVTIMGHVDHGKTSLLDKIRNSRVANSEAGGITQHIGAYMVEKNGKLISFIDTPGHEAFTQMRSRGAQITDIAIIVIAADDGVKPQTIEALNHAKNAGVQIIIAMNKMDKEDANPDKLKAECAELGFTPIQWGGDYEFIPISARSGEGIDTLLETILIQAEVMELKVSHEGRPRAVVLEGSLEKGRGPVATVILQSGTLKVGSPIVADVAFGRVRALLDDMGNSISSLMPSAVAVVTGLSEVPSAGSILYGVESDAVAKDLASKRAIYLRQKELSKSTKVSFDELGEMVAKGQLKTLSVIIKADTRGSLEAIMASLEKLSNDEVNINIIGSGVGGISQSDIDLCSASDNAIILGFNVRPTGMVRTKAKELGVEIKTYSVIYALIDDMQALVNGMMSPVFDEENTGQAEVRDTFNIPKVGTIAGCIVSDGVIARGIKVRLIRDGVVIHNGSIASLKRFKDDAREVSKGYECGIMLEGYNDVRVGDVFETYKEVQKNING